MARLLFTRSIEVSFDIGQIELRHLEHIKDQHVLKEQKDQITFQLRGFIEALQAPTPLLQVRSLSPLGFLESLHGKAYPFWEALTKTRFSIIQDDPSTQIRESAEVDVIELVLSYGRTDTNRLLEIICGYIDDCWLIRAVRGSIDQLAWTRETLSMYKGNLDSLLGQLQGFVATSSDSDTDNIRELKAELKKYFSHADRSEESDYKFAQEVFRQITGKLIFPNQAQLSVELKNIAHEVAIQILRLAHENSLPSIILCWWDALKYDRHALENLNGIVSVIAENGLSLLQQDGNAALYKAIEDGDHDLVTALLSSEDTRGLTAQLSIEHEGLIPLWIAIQKYRTATEHEKPLILKILNRLVELASDEQLLVPNTEGKTPIVFAIQNRDITLLQVFAKKTGRHWLQEADKTFPLISITELSVKLSIRGTEELNAAGKQFLNSFLSDESLNLAILPIHVITASIAAAEAFDFDNVESLDKLRLYVTTLDLQTLDLDNCLRILYGAEKLGLEDRAINPIIERLKTLINVVEDDDETSTNIGKFSGISILALYKYEDKLGSGMNKLLERKAYYDEETILYSSDNLLVRYVLLTSYLHDEANFPKDAALQDRLEKVITAADFTTDKKIWNFIGWRFDNIAPEKQSVLPSAVIEVLSIDRLSRMSEEDLVDTCIRVFNHLELKPRLIAVLTPQVLARMQHPKWHELLESAVYYNLTEIIDASREDRDIAVKMRSIDIVSFKSMLSRFKETGVLGDILLNFDRLLTQENLAIIRPNTLSKVFAALSQHSELLSSELKRRLISAVEAIPIESEDSDISELIEGAANFQLNSNIELMFKLRGALLHITQRHKRWPLEISAFFVVLGLNDKDFVEKIFTFQVIQNSADMNFDNLIKTIKAFRVLGLHHYIPLIELRSIKCNIQYFSTKDLVQLNPEYISPIAAALLVKVYLDKDLHTSNPEEFAKLLARTESIRDTACLDLDASVEKACTDLAEFFNTNRNHHDALAAANEALKMNPSSEIAKRHKVKALASQAIAIAVVEAIPVEGPNNLERLISTIYQVARAVAVHDGARDQLPAIARAVVEAIPGNAEDDRLKLAAALSGLGRGVVQIEPARGQLVLIARELVAAIPGDAENDQSKLAAALSGLGNGVAQIESARDQLPKIRRAIEEAIGQGSPRLNIINGIALFNARVGSGGAEAVDEGSRTSGALTTGPGALKRGIAEVSPDPEGSGTGPAAKRPRASRQLDSAPAVSPAGDAAVVAVASEQSGGESVGDAVQAANGAGAATENPPAESAGAPSGSSAASSQDINSPANVDVVMSVEQVSDSTRENSNELEENDALVSWILERLIVIEAQKDRRVSKEYTDDELEEKAALEEKLEEHLEKMRQKKPEGSIDNMEKSNPEAANMPEVKPGVLVGAVAAVTGGIAALRAYMHHQGAENAEAKAKAPEAPDQTEPHREERSELKGMQDGQKGNAENVPDLDQSALRFTPFLGGKMMLGGDVQALQEQQVIKAVYAVFGGVYAVQAVVSVQVSFMLRVLDAMAALNTVAMITISDFINARAESYGVDVAIDSAGRVSIVGEDSV